MVSARPRLLVPLLTTALIVLVLLSLGTWQLQRRADKHALIAALTERLALPPASLPPPSQWSALTPARDEFRRVNFRAALDAAASAGVYSSGSPLRKDVSGQGVWAFAPARLANGESVVVNRGFLPDAQAGLLRQGDAARDVLLTGYIRFPEAPGWLTPPGDVAKRLWFARDIAAMARWDGSLFAPFYIDLESPMPAAGWPKPGPLDVHLKDDHLQYALTWFSLAFAVMVGFAVWLRGSRRAGLSSRARSGSFL